MNLRPSTNGWLTGVRSWLAVGSALVSGWTFAQLPVTDECPDSTQTNKLTIHGNFDMYYKWVEHGFKATTTSFTGKEGSFQFGMASVQLGYQSAKLGGYLDLGFGPRARDFAYTDDGAMSAVKQAYVYYDLLGELSITAGTWATHIGYEVLDPALNSNYSMSYLFSTGPFSNTGIKVEYGINTHHLMVGLSNPTDYRIVPEGQLHSKTWIARYSYQTDNGLVLALNYSGGRQLDSATLHQFDWVATIPLSENISLGWNGSLVRRKEKAGSGVSQRQCWWGQAVYLKADIGRYLQFGFREEYFADRNGASPIPLAGDVWSLTATLQWRLGVFILPLELRWDKSSGERLNGSEFSGLVAVVYQF